VATIQIVIEKIRDDDGNLHDIKFCPTPPWTSFPRNASGNGWVQLVHGRPVVTFAEDELDIVTVEIPRDSDLGIQ